MKIKTYKNLSLFSLIMFFSLLTISLSQTQLMARGGGGGHGGGFGGGGHGGFEGGAGRGFESGRGGFDNRGFENRGFENRPFEDRGFENRPFERDRAFERGLEDGALDDAAGYDGYVGPFDDGLDDGTPNDNINNAPEQLYMPTPQNEDEVIDDIGPPDGGSGNEQQDIMMEEDQLKVDRQNLIKEEQKEFKLNTEDQINY